MHSPEAFSAICPDGHHNMGSDSPFTSFTYTEPALNLESPIPPDTLAAATMLQIETGSCNPSSVATGNECIAAVCDMSMSRERPTPKHNELAFESKYSWVQSWKPDGADDSAKAKLRAANALHLPCTETLLLLIDYYFLYAYYSFPVLSQLHFFQLLHADESDTENAHGPISLALLNALLYIGSAVRIGPKSPSHYYLTFLLERPISHDIY